MTTDYIDILRGMIEFLKVGFYENTDLDWPWYGNDNSNSKIYLGYWGQNNEKYSQKVPRIVAQRVSAINYQQTVIDERVAYDITGSFDAKYAVLMSAQFAYNIIAANDLEAEKIAQYVMDMVIVGKKDMMYVIQSIHSMGSAQLSVPSTVTSSNVSEHLYRVYVTIPIVWEHDISITYTGYDTYQQIQADGNLNEETIIIKE